MLDFAAINRLKAEKPWLQYCWSQRSNALYGPTDKETVKCSRPGPWGNPFVVGRNGREGQCCDFFEDWLSTGNSHGCVDATEAKRRWILDNIKSLKGKNLLCWCRTQWVGKRCHTETLARLANQE